MKHTLLKISAALLVASQLTACIAPLAVGAIAGGAMAVSDRRTFGSNASDRQIEFRASNAIGSTFPKAHVNSQVYNASVLLTGEVASVDEGRNVEALVRTLPNVRGVVNELGVGEPSSLRARAADTAITTKVNSAFLTDKLIQSGAFTVTTERGIVYLQGRVSNAEGARAAELARTVSGVRTVVKVFEYLTDEEFRRLNIKS